MGKSDLPSYAVFASGSGTIFQSILQAQENGNVHGHLALFITDNPDCKARERAERAGVPVQVFSAREFSKRKAREEAMLAALKQKEVDCIVLAGFMKLLSPFFISYYPEKIINTHPALLPAFKGLNAVKKAYAYGVKITGCTVHLVNAEVDGGPILLQKPVQVSPEDSVTSLHEKIKEEERVLILKALNSLLTGKITARNNHRWVMADE